MVGFGSEGAGRLPGRMRMVIAVGLTLMSSSMDLFMAALARLQTTKSPASGTTTVPDVGMATADRLTIRPQASHTKDAYIRQLPPRVPDVVVD